MCRFAAYLGPTISVESLTTLPSHSIIKQSYHAQERLEPLNGDGFGIAWFDPSSDQPAVYRAVTPAWNDENLMHLARVTRSGCILAHVRAASPGLGVSHFNCHPFLGDGLAFMHNGGVAGFGKLKRPLLDELDDALWYAVRGTTDSETLFAVFRHLLATRTEATKHERMRCALDATIARVLALSSEHGVPVEPLCDRRGIARHNSLCQPRRTELALHQRRQTLHLRRRTLSDDRTRRPRRRRVDRQ